MSYQKIASIQSIEYARLSILPATMLKKENKKTGGKDKVFKPKKDAKTEYLQISLTASKTSKLLKFSYQSEADQIPRTVATFSVNSDATVKLSFEPSYIDKVDRIHLPINSNYDQFESTSLENLFAQWVFGDAFYTHLTSSAATNGYTVGLVKMILFYISYLETRTNLISGEKGTGDATSDLEVSTEEVISNYTDKINMAIKTDLGHLARHYQELPTLSSVGAEEPAKSSEAVNVAVNILEPAVDEAVKSFEAVVTVDQNVSEAAIESVPNTVDVPALTVEEPSTEGPY